MRFGFICVTLVMTLTVLVTAVLVVADGPLPALITPGHGKNRMTIHLR